MKSFRATTVIACPRELVWSVLTDTACYGEWAVGTHRLDGQIANGAQLQLYTASKPNQPMVLKASHVLEPETFTLSGGLPLGLFRGNRTVTLLPRADGATEFTLVEVFSGLLEPVMGGMLPDLTPSFENFAAALKQRCEARTE